ncbi:hypothetical protein AB1E18_000406 [Capra hircus]
MLQTPFPRVAGPKYVRKELQKYYTGAACLRKGSRTGSKCLTIQKRRVIACRTYRTSSTWNSSQSANSSRREINCAQSTLLPSVNEPPQKTQKMPGLDPELSLEGLDDVPPLSPLQQISDEKAV